MAENSDFTQNVLDYILKNENADPYALALRKSPFVEVDMKTISRQIQGRKTAKRKFPFLLEIDQYSYPKKESLEQASSEQMALFKANLISGDSFVDLTGGMGIDTYLLGEKFQSCSYIEPNADLYHTTARNFKHLGFDQCTTHNTTCEEFLQSNKKRYDWAYIDPSRRIDGSRKTSIHNYIPNVVEIQNQISDLAENVMIKLSPMQDISECLGVLNRIHTIYVISLRNEVKELLLHLRDDFPPSPTIKAIDIRKEDSIEFTHVFNRRHCTVNTAQPKRYLYQPGSALVKAELQNLYAEQMGIDKLHPNTQIYTSNKRIKDFFGRTFEITERINLNKKEIKRSLPTLKANVITKNFPITAQELMNKYKIKAGGEKYLIAFTDLENKKTVAVCKKLVEIT